jgi:hypothetical protein
MGSNTIWRELYETVQKMDDVPRVVELNEYLTEQINRVKKMGDVTDKEFGALLVRDSKRIKLDFIMVGEDRAIELDPKRKLDPDEFILGTIHLHPITNRPSVHDMGSFLKSPWEQVMMLIGSEGTIWLLRKTPETIVPKEDLNSWKQMVGEQDYNMVQLAEAYHFEVFNGSPEKLKSLYPTGRGESNVDDLLKDIRGIKDVTQIESIKKSPFRDQPTEGKGWLTYPTAIITPNWKKEF